jgi:hypothetical protein
VTDDDRAKRKRAGANRNREAALRNAATFRDIAQLAATLAEAIEDGDNILGPLASAGFMDALTSLPHGLRADIAEAVSDEAARAQRADMLYVQESA